MAKKKEVVRVDGLSPKNLAQISSACRRVWAWSTPRRMCVARSTDSEGYLFCEKCKQRTPKHHIDHIIPVGSPLSDGFVKRLFVSSSGLQALCKQCHKIKSKEDQKLLKKDK